MSYKKNKVDQALAETMYSARQQKNRGKALIYSLLILGAILMILFIIKLPPMDPPLNVLQEIQDNGGGGEIVLGQDLIGANSNDFASAGYPEPTNQPIQEVVPTPVEETQPDPVEEAKPNEEPIIEKKEVKKEKEPIKTPIKPLEIKPEEKKIVEKKVEIPVKETPKEPAKVVDKRSLFTKSGAGGPGGSASSQGTGTTAGGVQGSPNGRGTSFTGGGTTSGTGSGQGSGDGPGNGYKIGGGLTGRKLVRPPIVKCQTEQQGKVNILLSVDKDGNITEARSTRGTTISDKSLIDCAEQAAQKMKFEANPDAPEIQTGVVTFTFKLSE